MIIKIVLILIIIIDLVIGNYSRIMMMRNFKDRTMKRSNLFYFFQGLLFDYTLLNEKGKKFYKMHIISAIIFFITVLITIALFVNK